MGLWVSPHLLFVPILYYLCPFSLPVKQDNPPLFLTLGMSYWQSGQAVKKRAAGRKAFTQTIPKTITCLLTWNIPSPLTHQGLKLLAIHFSVPPSGPPPLPNHHHHRHQDSPQAQASTSLGVSGYTVTYLYILLSDVHHVLPVWGHTLHEQLQVYLDYLLTQPKNNYKTAQQKLSTCKRWNMWSNVLSKDIDWFVKIQCLVTIVICQKILYNII